MSEGVTVKISLKERWIQAMSKIPYSLIGYKGYSEQDAMLVCEIFRIQAPILQKLSTILALESETANLELAPTTQPITTKHSFPKADSIITLQPVTKPSSSKKSGKRRTVVQPKASDYPSPWCKVIKDGKVIRYEDANGRLIPDILWRTNNYSKLIIGDLRGSSNG